MKKILIALLLVCNIIIFSNTNVFADGDGTVLNDMNAGSQYDTADQAEGRAKRNADNCEGNVNDFTNLSNKIGNCMKSTKLIQVNGKATIEGAFKTKINKWTNNIALFLGILAVGSVIYGGLMMTLSAGEEERIKKAKDIVKWGLVGFLGVVMATTVVTLVINLMYGFAAK